MAKNGLHLITPTSAALTAGGFTPGDETFTINPNGSVRFSSINSPGAQTFAVDGVFSDQYDNYRIVVRGVSQGNITVQMRLRASGVDDATASSYVSQRLQASGTTVSGSRSTSSLSSVAFFSSSQRSGFVMDIYGPYLGQSTAWRTVTVSGSSDALIDDYAGTHNQSISYDGFKLMSSSPNNFSGVLCVYVMRK